MPTPPVAQQTYFTSIVQCGAFPTARISAKGDVLAFDRTPRHANDEWGAPAVSSRLAAALAAFGRTEGGLSRLRRWRTLACAVLMASALHLAFLAVRSPSGQAAWLIATLAALIPAGCAAPVIVAAERRLRRKRLVLARTFFGMGLRVDEGGRLVTNTAHPRVVLDPARR